jgi:CubicO group peptidase (beta-lactamase class C family)
MNKPEIPARWPLPLAEPQVLGFAADRLPRIATAIEGEIARKALPGAVLMIARRGRLAYCETFGHLDPVAGSAMPVNAMFSIASMTKPLVTVAALMLCEEGRMAVNQPVRHYLPQLAGMRVNPPLCDGAPGAPTEAALREMTIEDLMRHTAGLSYGRGDKAIYQRYPASSDAASSRWNGSEFLAHIASLPLQLAARIEPDAAKQKALWKTAQTTIIEEVCAVPLFEQLQVWAHKTNLDFGYKLTDAIHLGPVITELTTKK